MNKPISDSKNQAQRVALGGNGLVASRYCGVLSTTIYGRNLLIKSHYDKYSWYMADFSHVGFGIPYIVSTMLFVVVLELSSQSGMTREKTLSIESIYTHQWEAFTGLLHLPRHFEWKLDKWNDDLQTNIPLDLDLF